MSEPTRIVTPRLQRVLLSVIEELDIVIEQDRIDSGCRGGITRRTELRAELLEAFEGTAIASRIPVCVERLEKDG